MDYTTLENVKMILGAEETADDDLLAKMITEASRAIDRKCSGMTASDDYFKLETISGEMLTGDVDQKGRIFCRTRKPRVASVASAEYRASPMDSWQTIDANQVSFDGYTIHLWAGLSTRGRVQVRISYTGGFGATPADLPDDLINAADILAARFYKESKTGLTDTIGVAELGTMQYTKALPARVVEMLKPYTRRI